MREARKTMKNTRGKREGGRRPPLANYRVSLWYLKVNSSITSHFG